MEWHNFVCFQNLNGIAEGLLVEKLTIIVIYHACKCHLLIISEQLWERSDSIINLRTLNPACGVEAESEDSNLLSLNPEPLNPEPGTSFSFSGLRACPPGG